VEGLGLGGNESHTTNQCNQVKEILIQRRDTHIDSLTSLLREPRVKAVLEPILAGKDLGDVPIDDVEFLLDLGLCRIDETGNVAIANPIYQEFLPRILAFTTTISLGQLTPSWLTDRGDLDPRSLLEAFLQFWRQNGQPLLANVHYQFWQQNGQSLLANVHYHEIAPHIVLIEWSMVGALWSASMPLVAIAWIFVYAIET
jgi:hypothetical protein